MLAGKTKKKKDRSLNDLLLRLYDFLMAEIEPDLTTGRLPLLAELYADETAEQRSARQKHYEWAFQKYEELWGVFTEKCTDGFTKMKEGILREYQEKSTKEDMNAMRSIEDALRDLAI
jgi:hypothetical protein